MLPQATADYYRQQQRLAVVAVVAARRTWARMTNDFDRSWVAVRPGLEALLAAAQLAAARASSDYIAAVLAETNQPDAPVAALRPKALVDVAPDGRPLDGLLDGAVIKSKIATQTMPAPDALSLGGRWLDMAVSTVIADTGRNASSVEIAIRPDIDGYVRMLNQPSCSRCIVQAGKFFRWNKGFLRHPSCDCRHVPASEDVAGDFRTDPRQYFDSISKTEQDRVFGKAGSEAIRDGADIGQVVNARSSHGVSRLYTTADGQLATRAGTVRQARDARLMPEAIYRQARSRDEAIALLRQHSFI